MKIPELNNQENGRGVFKAPQGYFDNLEQRIMQRVSEAGDTVVSKRKVRFWKTEAYARLKPYIYMAAMFGGLYFGVWVYKYQQRVIAKKTVAAQLAGEKTSKNSETSEDEIYSYVNDACDYMMIDNHDIVACLTGAE